MARFLTKIIKILLLGWINKVLGGLFGSLKYLVLISFVVVFFDNINSEFSVVETKEVEKVMLFKPFLEVGNNLLKIVNYDSIDFLIDLSSNQPFEPLLNSTKTQSFNSSLIFTLVPSCKLNWISLL